MIYNYSYRQKAARKKSAPDLIKYVSIETYNRIGFVHKHSLDPLFFLKIGETTLTENLLYELHKFSLEKKLSLFRMFEAKNEGAKGADILLDLPVAGGYLRIPVQAKRIYLNSGASDDGIYAMFHYTNKTHGKQSELLKAYAAELESYLPLYLLYNFTSGSTCIAPREKEYYYGCSYLNINNLSVALQTTSVRFSDVHPFPARPFYRLFEYLGGRGGGGGSRPSPPSDPKEELRAFYAFFGMDVDDAFLEKVRLYTHDEVFADDKNWSELFTKTSAERDERYSDLDKFEPRYRIVMLSEPETPEENKNNVSSDGGEGKEALEGEPQEVFPYHEMPEEEEQYQITNTF